MSRKYMSPRYAIAGSLALASLWACGSSTLDSSTTYQPITSILVRAESARGGKACSQADDAVFKYAAVLRTDKGTVVSGGVYDCFSDAAFRDPPFDPESVIPTFKVDVYAFSKKAFDTVGAGAIDTAARSGDTSVLGATSVTCEAIPRTDVEVVAVCSLSLADGGAPTDGGADGQSPADTGSDGAQSTDAADASDAGDANDANDGA